MPDQNKYVPEFYPNNSVPIGAQHQDELRRFIEALTRFSQMPSTPIVPINGNGFPMPQGDAGSEAKRTALIEAMARGGGGPMPPLINGR